MILGLDVSLKRLLTQEKQSLQLIVLLTLLVPLIWWLFFSWSPGELIDQHDNLMTGYVYKQQFIEVQGDWKRFLYWPQLLGGVKVHDITGSLPIVEMLVALGADYVTISNVSVFFVQILFGYFCTHIMFGLTTAVLGGTKASNLATLIPAGLLFAFLPVLGWRMTHGHLAIIMGLFVFLCMTSLILDEINGRRSPIRFLLALLALTNTFQYNGFQTMYYSVLFGAPIVLALILAPPGFKFSERCRWLVFPLIVFLCALLFSVPKLMGMFANAFSDEVGRAAGQNVIYSYTVATIADWLSSIPWSTNFIPADRAQFLHHEVNYPLGAVALLCLLVKPTPALVKVYVGISISILACIVISSNVKPLSNFLVSLIPMLDAFRVPARGILVPLTFMSILGVALLTLLIGTASKTDNEVWKVWMLCFLAIILAALAPALVADLLLAALVVGLLVFKKQCVSETYLLTLSIFAGAAIAAYGTRVDVPIENPISPEIVLPFRNTILSQAPELAEPLNRAQVLVQLQGMGYNSALVMGISSLTGYWYPPSRYGRLFAEVNGYQYSPASAVFHNNAEFAGYSVLNRLYNVQASIGQDQGQLIVTPMEATLGKAWFSTRITWQSSLAELAVDLKRAGNAGLQQSARLLTEDPATQVLKAAGLDCQHGELIGIRDTAALFPLHIDVSTKGKCLLTVSMNYSNIFSAVDQDGSQLTLVPTYGALLGVIATEATQRITITPQVVAFDGVDSIRYIAMLLALGLLRLSAHRSKRNLLWT